MPEHHIHCSVFRANRDDRISGKGAEDQRGKVGAFGVKKERTSKIERVGTVLASH
jgi:hypothetical protein